MKLLSSLALVALILAVALSAGAAAPIYAGFEPQPPAGPEDPGAALRARFLADQEPAQAMTPMAFTPCVAGMAGIYPCSNVDLGAFCPTARSAAAAAAASGAGPTRSPAKSTR